MRLLHTQSLQLHSFSNPRDTPPYAILSHTWGEDEVTWDDVSGGRQGLAAARKRVAWPKLKGFCDLAVSLGYEYAWIDTCSINKSSSSELSEAINSMFQWYREAGVCIAYLDDAAVTPRTPPTLWTGSTASTSTNWKTAANAMAADTAGSSPSVPPVDKWLSQCRWFTRGWTLQELIAPKHVDFYTADWTKIGDRAGLASIISAITSIDVSVLTSPIPGPSGSGSSNGGSGGASTFLRTLSISKRMSWAANRRTTRPEDIAYCLLGLFGVNMPLLYGEGQERAFARLQEEIMKDSADQTIFAWEGYTDVGNNKVKQASHVPRGVLAAHPYEFKYAARFAPSPAVGAEPFRMTNKGLRIDMKVVLTKVGGGWLGVLACHEEGNFLGPVGIPLKSTPEGDVWIRAAGQPRIVHHAKHDNVDRRVVYLSKFITPTEHEGRGTGSENSHGGGLKQFWLQAWPNHKWNLLGAWPADKWTKSTRVMQFHVPELTEEAAGTRYIGIMFFATSHTAHTMPMPVRSRSRSTSSLMLTASPSPSPTTIRSPSPLSTSATISFMSTETATTTTTGSAATAPSTGKTAAQRFALIFGIEAGDAPGQYFHFILLRHHALALRPDIALSPSIAQRFDWLSFLGVPDRVCTAGRSVETAAVHGLDVQLVATIKYKRIMGVPVYAVELGKG